MKLIFLDFDGVLNTKTTEPPCVTIHDRFYPSLEIDKIALLNRICKENNANVVICSSWREQLDISLIEAWLTVNGFLGDFFVKSSVNGEHRGFGINDFLRFHALDFVILDDEAHWYEPYPALRQRLIGTCPEIGLSEQHILQARQMFSM